MLAARLVCQQAGFRVERQYVALLGIFRCGAALDDMQAQVERVAAEDVTDTVAADDHDLEPGLLRDGLEPGRAHLPRRPDTEALAGDHERLPSMHPLTKIRHQVTKGARFPARVEMVEALRNAVIGRGDLVGVDGVELLPRDLRVPADDRATSHQVTAVRRPVDGLGGRSYRRCGARLTSRGLDRVQEGSDEPILSSRSSTASAASVVFRAPPRSFVVRRSAAADMTARSIRSAPASSPRCLSIMAPARMAPTGLAMPLPACLGAEPCTGSKSPRRLSGLMFAEGAWPRPPTSSEARSLRMSPNILDVTMTSKRLGSLTSCIAAASTKRCSASISGDACRSRAKTRCQRSCA